MPATSNPLFIPSETPLPAPEMDPPSFNEFLRSSNPLEDNNLGLTQDVEKRRPPVPPPKPYFTRTIGTTHPRNPNPPIADQTMMTLLCRIQAQNDLLIRKNERTESTTQELLTTVDGLRGDIRYIEGKVERTYRMSIDNLERGNVTGDMVGLIHTQEAKRIKPLPMSAPLPARPKTPVLPAPALPKTAPPKTAVKPTPKPAPPLLLLVLTRTHPSPPPPLPPPENYPLAPPPPPQITS